MHGVLGSRFVVAMSLLLCIAAMPMVEESFAVMRARAVIRARVNAHPATSHADVKIPERGQATDLCLCRKSTDHRDWCQLLGFQVYLRI